MINELKQKIEMSKNVLDTLPKNNNKNISKYKMEISNLLDEYKLIKSNVLNEIKTRYNKLSKIEVNSNLSKLNKEIEDIKRGFYLLSNYNSSYEKLGLDKYIYNISKYYKNNLEYVNENIIHVLDIFNNAKVKINITDFNYSVYVREYMKIIFDNKTNIDTDEVKNSLLNIYLKCSDVLVYIELNFKYLYYKNKVKFDNYASLLKTNYLSNRNVDEVKNYYFSKVKEYDNELYNDKYLLITDFMNKKNLIMDYTDDKINVCYNKIVEDIDSVSHEEIIGLSNSILEYKSYLEVSYIIEDIKKLYQNKDSYKNLVKNDFKEIKKIESKIFKINKKFEFNKRLKKDCNNLLVEVNKLILSLKPLYDKLEEDKFLEIINNNLKDNSTYYDVLDIVSNNYLYIIKCIKNNFEDISLEDINKKTDKVYDILLNPYNKFINNISITSDKDIKMIIGNYYKLSDFKVDINTFENETDIDSIKDSIDKIIVYDKVKKSGYKINDISFMYEVKELNIE